MKKLALLFAVTLLSSITLTSQSLLPEGIYFTTYNHHGEQSKVIEQTQSQGKHQIIWNAEGLPAGLYFCVLKTESGMQTVKMIKL